MLLVNHEVRRGDVVLDVGARNGDYTVRFSRLVGPEGRVVAFEPDPAKFEILCQNIELNGCTNVTAVQRDVSSAPLDDYFAARPTAVDFVKVDVQGWEGHALAGMQHLLAANPDVRILTEFWPAGLEAAGIRPDELLDRLEAWGFRIYLVDEWEGVHPFDRERFLPALAAAETILFCTRANWRPSYDLPTTHQHVHRAVAAIARHIPSASPIVLIDQEKSLLDA